MSTELIIILVVALIFGAIVLYNFRFFLKQKSKNDEPKEKVEKPKKEKIIKEKKVRDGAGKTPEMLKKDQFLRPSDIAKAQAEEKRKILEQQQAEEEQRKKEDEARRDAEKIKEGETDNESFQYAGDAPFSEVEEKKDEDVEIIEPNISEEIKNLSPEMKALLFGDVLKQK